MNPTKDDIRRRLGLREVPKPPDDLVRRLKADIPPSFRYTNQVARGRSSAASSAAFRGMSWQVAASFLVLTLAGVGVYMVTFEREQQSTARLAEADRAPAMEFSPPTSPAASAPSSVEAKESPKRQENESSSKLLYDIPAPPPPPPPAPHRSRADKAVAQGVEIGVAGGVEGGVYGGVAGGVVGGSVAGEAETVGADTDDYAREQPAEAQVAKGKDLSFAEERVNVAPAAAPAAAPASVAAAPAAAGARDEKASGIKAEPAPAVSANDGLSITSLRAKADAGEILRVGGAVKAPVVLERVEIVYPVRAREARVQGVVVVEAVIGRDGRVRDVRVLKPLPLGLTEAATAAVRQWTFKPATLEGKPVDAYFTLTVNAKLAE